MHPDLISDLHAAYGIEFTCAKTVSGGWMNKKWRLDGKLLLKQYSRERFDDRKLAQVEEALQRQLILESEGIPCPHIFTCEGRAIRRMPDGKAYMLMEFREGEIVGPETVNAAQLSDLGRALGRIQSALSRQSAVGARGWPMDSKDVLVRLYENLKRRNADLFISGEYARAVASMNRITGSLTEDYLDSLPRGLSHEDFTPDNVLLLPDRVSAVLDFDRTQYGFLWRDVGQAILSLCLREDEIDRACMEIFLDGYSRFMPRPDPVAALRAVWCVEAPWWIVPGTFTHPSSKIARFRDELLWLTEHYFHLEEML